jgi:hypothetical protein
MVDVVILRLYKIIISIAAHARLSLHRHKSKAFMDPSLIFIFRSYYDNLLIVVFPCCFRRGQIIIYLDKECWATVWRLNIMCCYERIWSNCALNIETVQVLKFHLCAPRVHLLLAWFNKLLELLHFSTLTVRIISSSQTSVFNSVHQLSRASHYGHRAPALQKKKSRHHRDQAYVQSVMTPTQMFRGPFHGLLFEQTWIWTSRMFLCSEPFRKVEYGGHTSLEHFLESLYHHFKIWITSTCWAF